MPQEEVFVNEGTTLQMNSIRLELEVNHMLPKPKIWVCWRAYIWMNVETKGQKGMQATERYSGRVSWWYISVENSEIKSKIISHCTIGILFARMA